MPSVRVHMLLSLSTVSASLSVATPPCASAPWLRKSAFADGSSQLEAIATEVEQLQVGDLDLVKAFVPRNSADAAFASDRPSIQWTSMRDGPFQPPALVCPPEAALGEALRHARAPLSARLATRESGRVVSTTLSMWLGELADSTRRDYRDADAYMTAAPHGSASLGWHVDDVDVLLVMLRGSKRFRVAGEAVGSDVVIDHVMERGDAIYIPALTFHSGGDSSTDDSETASTSSSSTMLSVAMAPGSMEESDARVAVVQWRRARDAIRRLLPSPSCNTWRWASSSEGRLLVQRTLSEGELTRRFCVAAP